MKKLFTSKKFIFAILAICWLVGRDTKTAFLPDEPSPDAVQEEWTDTPDTAGSSREHADSGIPSQSSAEEKLKDHPKVAEGSEQEVVVDFVRSTSRVRR